MSYAVYGACAIPHSNNPPEEIEILEIIYKSLERGEVPRRYALIAALCEKHIYTMKQERKPKNRDEFTELAQLSSARYKTIEGIFHSLTREQAKICIDTMTGDISITAEGRAYILVMRNQKAPA